MHFFYYYEVLTFLCLLVICISSVLITYYNPLPNFLVVVSWFVVVCILIFLCIIQLCFVFFSTLWYINKTCHLPYGLHLNIFSYPEQNLYFAIFQLFKPFRICEWCEVAILYFFKYITCCTIYFLIFHSLSLCSNILMFNSLLIPYF